MLSRNFAGDLLARIHGTPLNASSLFEQKCGRWRMYGEFIRSIRVDGHSTGQWDSGLDVLCALVEILAESGNIDATLESDEYVLTVFM